MKQLHFLYSIIFLLTFISCSQQVEVNSETNRLTEKKEIEEDFKELSLEERLSTFTLESYHPKDIYLQAIVDSIYNQLPWSERIGQMIMVAQGKEGKEKELINEFIAKRQVGGVLLLSEIEGGYGKTIQVFKETNQINKGIPLLFSVDAEPSLINYRIKGIQQFPKTSTIQSVEKAKEMARDICGVLNMVGVNYNFAPVYDVSANQDVINNRSFGGNYETVTPLANAFAQESVFNNIIPTAKHFPGHGLVKGDSHKKLVYINGELQELPIFKNAIDNGILSMMVGHIAIKNNPQFDTQGLPATISKHIVTDLLRNKMNFNGIIVTDAMNMKAVSKIKDADYRAILAGNDIILMPVNIQPLIDKVKQHISEDVSFEKQIEASVKRIIRVKICLGLFG